MWDTNENFKQKLLNTYRDELFAICLATASFNSIPREFNEIETVDKTVPPDCPGTRIFNVATPVSLNLLRSFNFSKA